MAAEILKLDNIRKDINGLSVLSNICLNIKRNDNFGFLGPGGSGKSALAGIIAGVHKADSGEILCKIGGTGKNLTGIIPHKPAVYDDATVLGNLRFFGSLSGLKRKEFPPAADSVLETCGLSESKKKYAAGLTRLEKHRLNIACGIIHNPEIIIFDEPGYGLDPPERAIIIGLVRKISSRRNTVLLFSRQAHIIENICTKAALLCQGKIIASGKIDEIRKMISDKSVIRLRVSGMEQSLIQKLMNLPEVSSAGSTDSELIIEYRTEDSALNNIFTELKKQKVSVISAADDFHDLGTVFEALTGIKLNPIEAG